MNKHYTHTFFLTGLLLLITCGFSTQVIAQAPEISPQLIKVSKKRISRTVYEFTFKATLINHNIPIKNVTALITSSSPHTVIMSDNQVTFNDVAANETVTSVDTFTLRQDRRFPYNPDDIHWNIQYEPDVPPIAAPDVEISLINLARGGQFPVNKGKSHTTAIHFISKQGNTPYTVRIAQSITPAAGLTITPNLNGTEFTYTVNTVDKHHQIVRATQPGEYQITTTATVVETGATATHVAKYKVLSVDEPDIFVTSPIIDYVESNAILQALKPDSITQVALALSSPTGRDYDKVIGIKILSPELGTEVSLNDDGLGVDEVAGDRDFGYQVIEIDTHGMPSGECLHFYAIVSTTKGDVTTPSSEICISNLVFDKSYIQNEQNILSNGTYRFSSKTFGVIFVKGTSDERIQEIIDSIDGTIVDGAYSSMSFTIKLNNPPPPSKAEQVLDQVIDKLETFPEVEGAGYTIFGQTLSLYTNDPLYHSVDVPFDLNNLSGMEQARADEAWYVVRGKEPIIVIDTGIDKNHEDLKNKIDWNKAYNTAEDNTDVQDFVHHGSHVAGIAAAQSNNGLGIASVSWDSPIIPIKMYPGKTHKDLSAELMKKAIEYVAKKKFKNQKIINYSSGFEITELSFACALHVAEVELLGIPVFLPPCIQQLKEIKRAKIAKKLICDAVSTISQKKFFIAAAGDSDSTNKVYPAACSQEVISVAAVEPSDPLDFTYDPVRWIAVPSKGSQYGDWVTLSAPGSQILSTVPKSTCVFNSLQQFFFPCLEDEVYGYQHASGTSQAAPFVAGTVAAVMARHPEYNKEKVMARITNAASDIVDDKMGAGALNVFDAVFNGSFELTNEDNPIRLAEWEHKETSDAFLHCKAVSFFGNITPPKGEKMLSCGTQGVYEFNTSLPSAGSSVKNRINLPEGVTHLPLSFRWKVASVDLSLPRQTVLWDDRITFRLRRVDDPSKEVILFDTSFNHIMNNGRHLSASFIYPFVETDWTLDSYAHPIPYGAGEYELIIGIADRYDNVGDTYIFVDDLQFRLR
jgi:subtilisin family serine protease